MASDDAPGVRLDKWLWAARFFKTRSLATDAVEGGKVHLNGARSKPAKGVKPGDRLDVSIGDMHWTIVVRALSERRGPAPVARELYEETPESLKRREEQLERRKLEPEPSADMHGRPTKKDRRRIVRFREGS